MLDRVMERQHNITFVKSTLAAWALTALLLFLAHILGGLIVSIPVAFGGVVAYRLSPRLSPALVLRFYKGVEVSPNQMVGLHRMVREISRRAAISVIPTLWLLPSSRPIAFVTGDRSGSAIALSTGLLDTLDPEELSGVMAHELSHIAHNDSRIMWFSEVTVKMVSLLSVVGQVMVLINLPALFKGERDISLVLLAVVVASPVVAMLLQLALLRTREFAADMGSAELLGSPRPLIRALRRLEGGRLPLILRLVAGSREQKGHTLLRTHPSVHDRIRRLMALEGEGARQHSPIEVTEEELVAMLLKGDRGDVFAKRDRSS